MSDLRSLIRRGRDLDLEIKQKTVELKTIKTRLIDAGAGEHLGTGGAKAQVILPAPSLSPDAAAIEEVKRLVGAKRIPKLFSAAMVLTPVKAFREVALALLGEQLAPKVIAACEKETAPRVLFS